MAIASQTAFSHSIDKTISRQFFDEYADYPAEYEQIAKMGNLGDHMGNDITESELSPLGALRNVPEGSAIQFDTPVQGNKRSRYFTKYGLGFQVTEEQWRDDLHRNFRGMPQKLAKSARYKAESVFWDLFNNGFGTHLAIDGQYIFDTDHSTLKSSETIDNDPTAAALSETTLQAAFEYFDNLIDDAGNPIIMRPKWLIVPTELQWTAAKLYKGDYKVASMDNDINTVANGNILTGYSWMPFVSRWLTSSTAWFVLSEDHDFRFIWRFPTRLESRDDFLTGNAQYKCVQRHTAFCNQYRGGYGNAGA